MVTMAFANHLIYLLMSMLFTVYVGCSLYTHGRVFLLECWGEARLADAVNKFLLIGFYLLNAAFVLLLLRYGATGTTIESTIEILAGRVGFVVLVMGAMHINNILICETIRRRRAKLVN